MNRASFSYLENKDEKECAESVQRRLQNMTHYRNQNWKMSYSFVRSAQKDVLLQRKATYLVCSYKDKLQNACPADIRMLKHSISEDSKVKRDDSKKVDADVEEYEADLDVAMEEPKLSTWEEYKRLVEASQLKPKPDPSTKPQLTDLTGLSKIRIDRGHFKLRQRVSTQAKKSIIRGEVQNRLLVANTNYVQFRNFQLKKLYKRRVTLQNVSNSPVRFQMEARPARSKFRIMMEPIVENRNIVAPGLSLQLIVTFRCDDIDPPEEMVIVNVHRGGTLVIRVHGYKDPPILLGTCLTEEISFRYSDTNAKLLDQTWYPEMATSFDSLDSAMTSSSDTPSIWDDSDDEEFIGSTFDCKKGFVGEEVYIPIKFKNVGGNGRIFIISETDWFTMDIVDVKETNVLKLPCFAVQPAYFSLKAKEEMTFHMYFTPECYGLHVEQLYILCDNCTILTTEIIGDGLVYEPHFIRLSKQFEKVWPFKRNIDKFAKYYVNLSTNTPDGNGQCIIIVNNVSEISMHFHWKKRNVETKKEQLSEENHFPLELLHIKPERGMFAPTSCHYFTLTVEYKDLRPNYYFAVLELYVEDIPVEAVQQRTELRTSECSTKRRKCSHSVDVWVADVEVWLQYMMDDEDQTRQTTDEILERILERPSDENYLRPGYYEFEETIDEMEGKEECSSTCQLVTDELFCHHDMISLKQFEPLWREQIISMGIVRPTRTLYIGVEETYILMLKNLASDSLKYSWGEVEGLDSEKMKLCVCPEKGEVSAGNTQKMEITITPIKEGFVQSLYIPCLVGDTRKTIMLGIECTIEPLHVCFYFPIGDKEPLELKNNFIRVEWRVDSLKFALDMAGKSRKHMKILDKYRAREERELMNTNLDQGAVLKDASAGPSMQEVDAEVWGEQSSLSTRTSEIIQMSNLKDENYAQGIISSGNIVPFFEKFVPFPTQPIVIEFLDLSLRTVQKKTFIIRNETSIPTNYWLRLKNYYPINCSCEWKTKEVKINSIYKRVFGYRKRVIDETLCRVKQPGSGVVIYVDPLNSDIGPFQAVPVDIYVFADTWGIYVDELEINITGLPQYTIGICVQVVGAPISLSISDRNEFNIPVIRYGTEATGVRLEERKVLLKNTSVIPIAINWYTFLVKPAIDRRPITVIFDIHTPFTDKLASKLKASKEKSDNEIHLEKHKNSPLSRILHTCDSVELSDSSYIGSSFATPSCTSYGETLDNTETSFEISTTNFVSDLNSCYEQCETCAKSTANEQSEQIKTEEKQDIEIEISVLPHYGLIDTKICSVTPKEMFILPNDNASLVINVQLEKYKSIKQTKEFLEGEVSCKILGFLRIAPSDMYKDNYYARHSGHYLSPIEIDVTVNITKPRLNFNISKSDRIFTCNASDIPQNPKKKLELTKTFFLYNNENKVIKIFLETFDPFYIKSVYVYADTVQCKSGTMCIGPYGCAEVQVGCIVNTELIQTIMNTSSTQDIHDPSITVKEMLHIVYADKHHQNLELILQIWLPVLKLSLYTLDFGLVYIGDTKKLTLTIKNLSISCLNFKINKKLKNKDFMIDHKGGTLLCQYSDEWNFTVTVSFHPKKAGQSVETLEIITNMPYNTEECQLYGEGTLDEKYHTPECYIKRIQQEDEEILAQNILTLYGLHSCSDPVILFFQRTFTFHIYEYNDSISAI